MDVLHFDGRPPTSGGFRLFVHVDMLAGGKRGSRRCGLPRQLVFNERSGVGHYRGLLCTDIQVFGRRRGKVRGAGRRRGR